MKPLLCGALILSGLGLPLWAQVPPAPASAPVPTPSTTPAPAATPDALGLFAGPGKVAVAHWMPQSSLLIKVNPDGADLVSSTHLSVEFDVGPVKGQAYPTLALVIRDAMSAGWTLVSVVADGGETTLFFVRPTGHQ